MQHRNFAELANGAATLSGLLAVTVFLAGSLQAKAQTHNTAQSDPSEPLVRLPGHMAREVLDGTALLQGHYNPEQTLRLAVVLALPHPMEEKQFLEDLQDKKSPQFHQFLSPQEWSGRFGPSADSEQAVLDWAQSQGLTVTHRYNNRLAVDLEAPAGAIEKALDLVMNSYQLPPEHGLEARTVYSNDRDPSVPVHLSGVIKAVLGLNSIVVARPNSGTGRLTPQPDYSPGPVVQPMQSAHKDASPRARSAADEPTAGPQVTPPPSDYYWPSDFWNSDIYDYQALMNQGHCCNPLHITPNHSPRESSIAIASFATVNLADIAGFQQGFPNLAYYVDTIPIDGTYTCATPSDDGCSEVTMDTEWSLSMANSQGAASDTARVVVYEGSNYTNAIIMDVYAQMESDAHARTMSTSWGIEENTQFSSNPEMDTYNTTMQSVDAVFAAMVGEGWTLVAASGDQGATAGCGDADAVQFPSSDPNVVGAGGTELNRGAGDLWEVAWTGGNSAAACGDNDGGGTGGFSEYFTAPGYQSALGKSMRAVPDISLDATHGHVVYYNGAWEHPGGTSVVAPMLAGFFAQANAYLLSIGSICGSDGTTTCAPMGNANYPIYSEGFYGTAAHWPFYDVTVGCNNNYITQTDHLASFCAGPGYDEATGWGSANMLQLAWAINWENIPATGAPRITFSGPATNTWYNTNQTVNWTIQDYQPSGGTPGTGIAGETQGWDSLPADPAFEPQGGSGNSFYSGPQYPNGATGCLAFEPTECAGGVSQGCHTAFARGWNNQGLSTAGQSSYPESYGPLCYDTVAPTISVVLNPASPTKTGWYTGPVSITMSATDPGSSGASGVAQIYYGIGVAGCQTSGTGSCSIYSSQINLTTQEAVVLNAFSEDKAGNFSPVLSKSIDIDSTPPVTTATLNGTIYSSGVYDSIVGVTLSATDNVSGIAKTYYILDGSAAKTYSETAFTVSALGKHTLEYWSVDIAGNIESRHTLSFAIQSQTIASVTASPNPSVNGQKVTIVAKVAATVSGTPTGSVVFYNGATKLGTVPLSGGKATLTTATLPVGALTLQASYLGAGNFIATNSPPFDQTVNESTSTSLTAAPDPAVFGSTVALTAKVKPSISGTPAGTVNFLAGASLIGSGTLNGSGVATLNVNMLAGGKNSLTAVYGGNAPYAASRSAAFSETVSKAATATALKTSLTPSTYGQLVTFTATVTSTAETPEGTVDFMSGGTLIGSGTTTAGVATFATQTLPAGTHSITAKYVASTDFEGSTSSPVSEVVSAAGTTTVLASAPNPSVKGKSVTFTATVSSAAATKPTGTVKFLANGKSLGTASLVSGIASFKTDNLAKGTDSITAIYEGNTDFTTSTSPPVSQVVNAP
jgi:hypothetical protein